MCRKNAGWSSKVWNSKANWQRSAVEDAGQRSQEKWKSSKTRAEWKDTSHCVEELGTLVREKKSTWIKSCKESSKKKDTEVSAKSEGVAEHAKVDEGARSRLRRTPQRQGRGKSGTRTSGRNAANLGLRGLLGKLVVWSSCFEVKLADGNCGGPGSLMDISLGRDDQATGAIDADLRCSV